jgi:ferredoxin/flavodoxin---NADP+ reductase
LPDIVYDESITSFMSAFSMDKTVADILAKGKSTLETVQHVRWWTDKLFTFTTTRSPDYAFVAGQYARLGLPDEHGAIWRAYSMTSAPDAEHLEFYGILVAGGLFTARLKDLEPGHGILVEKQAYGFMTVDRFTDGEQLWMLSTGTGIGPFISMLRDPLAWRNFRELILVHCVRHAEEFAYREELAQLAARAAADGSTARLRIVRTVTRDSDISEEGVLHGRITTLLDDGGLERAAGFPITEAAARIMLCGNPEMIEDTRKILHKRGLRPCRRTLPGQFVTENYW